LFVAFCAATQDIALDACRYRIARVQMQGAMVAAYQVGYRLALISEARGLSTIADHFSWHVSYRQWPPWSESAS